MVSVRQSRGHGKSYTIDLSCGSGDMNAADGTILPGASDSTDQVQQHASDPRYFIKISPGKKKFAPKVRSECLTCKYVLLV